MTLVGDVRPDDSNEAVVLGYFLSMKGKDWNAFEALWAEDAVQISPFRPDGLDNFIPSAFNGRAELMAHYRSALAKRREHEFWIDGLHRTEDPDVIIVECRGRSVVGENDRLYENAYVFIFTMRDGAIARLVDYANPLPIMRAFGDAFD